MATAPTFTPSEVAVAQQFFATNPTGAQIYEKASEIGLSPEQVAGLYQQSMGGDYGNVLNTVNSYLGETGQSLAGGYPGGLLNTTGGGSNVVSGGGGGGGGSSNNIPTFNWNPSQLAVAKDYFSSEPGPQKIYEKAVELGLTAEQLASLFTSSIGGDYNTVYGGIQQYLSDTNQSLGAKPKIPVVPTDESISISQAQPVTREVAAIPAMPTISGEDYFSRYFPVTVTGGRANPSVALNNVSGQLGLDTILANIQGQYTPQTFTRSGGSYGAGRFIRDFTQAGGAGSSVGGGTTGGGFQPGEFDINDYINADSGDKTDTLTEEELGTSTGSSGNTGESLTTGGSNVTYDPNDPYNGLFNSVPNSVKKALGLVMPGASLLIGAGEGYNNAIATNALNIGLGAYGGEGFGDVNPAKAAVMGAFGLTPDAIKAAKAFTDNFTDPANLYGYMAAAVDPAISQIAESLIAKSGGTLNADQVGTIGRAIGESVNANVAKKMSLKDAVRLSAIQFGVSEADAATMASNLTTEDSAPNADLAAKYTADQLTNIKAFWASNPTADEILDAMRINQLTPEQAAETWAIATGGDKQVGLNIFNEYMAANPDRDPRLVYDPRLDKSSPEYNPVLYNRVMAGLSGSGGTVGSGNITNGYVPAGLLNTGVVVGGPITGGLSQTTPLGPLSVGNNAFIGEVGYDQ